MATRFTRLSVVADDQQLDASLPASRPIVEFLDHIPTLLGIAPTGRPTAWSLSSPARGPIALDGSLDDAGVLDGDVLYLSPAASAAAPPLVDDVVAAVADAVDQRAPDWSGTARDSAVTVLLGVVGVALAAALAAGPNEHGSAVLLVLLGAAATAGAALLRSRCGLVLGWTVTPFALGVALVRISSGVDVRIAAAAAGVAAGVAGLGQAVHRNRAVTIAGAATAVTAASAAGALQGGVDATALAAWAAPVLVLVIGLLPQAGVTASGLLALVRQAESGNPVERLSVLRRTATGLAALDGLVAAVSIAGGAATATLIWAGRPAQASLGGLLAAVFLLRSRGFTPARQVAWFVAVSVIAAIAAAATLPDWLGGSTATAREAAWTAALVVVAAVVAGAGYLRLGEVPAARLSKLWDRLDRPMLVAVVPITLLAQNVFGWLAHRF